MVFGGRLGHRDLPNVLAFYPQISELVPPVFAAVTTLQHESRTCLGLAEGAGLSGPVS